MLIPTVMLLSIRLIGQPENQNQTKLIYLLDL